MLELEYTLIPHGLHVIGAPPAATERAELLDAAGYRPMPALARRSMRCSARITRRRRSCMRLTAAT